MSIFLPFFRISLRIALIGALGLALHACYSPPTPEEQRQRAVKAATGPDAMWYRFTYEARYGDEPVKIDQMVSCTRSVISGGSLGQSPDTVIHEGHPLAVAVNMSDGSQILARVPNMCKHYRKFGRVKKGKFPGWGYSKGWKSLGPQQVLPVIIWSDKLPRPDRIETYVSPEYYRHPNARIKDPHGAVDLWPVGRYPKNYAAVLAQTVALPRYPNPFVNPDRNPHGRGKGRDGRYHGVGDRFVSYVIVPVTNHNDWVEKFGELSMLNSQRRKAGLPAIDTQGVVLDEYSVSNKLVQPLEADRGFDNDGYRAYRLTQDVDEEFAPLAVEPSYVTHACVMRRLNKLLTGSPGLSDLPYDASENGTAWPDQARSPGLYFQAKLSRDQFSPKSQTFYNGKIVYKSDLKRYKWDVAKLRGLELRMRNCYAQLGKLKSFDVTNGRLDASRSLPGVMVYHRWFGPHVWMRPDAHADSFLASGAVDPKGHVYHLNIDTDRLDYALEGPERRDWDPVIFENDRTREWRLVFGIGEPFFSGEGENSGY